MPTTPMIHAPLWMHAGEGQHVPLFIPNNILDAVLMARGDGRGSDSFMRLRLSVDVDGALQKGRRFGTVHRTRQSDARGSSPVNIELDMQWAGKVVRAWSLLTAHAGSDQVKMEGGAASVMGPPSVSNAGKPGAKPPASSSPTQSGLCRGAPALVSPHLHSSPHSPSRPSTERSHMLLHLVTPTAEQKAQLAAAPAAVKKHSGVRHGAPPQVPAFRPLAPQAHAVNMAAAAVRAAKGVKKPENMGGVAGAGAARARGVGGEEVGGAGEGGGMAAMEEDGAYNVPSRKRGRRQPQQPQPEQPQQPQQLQLQLQQGRDQLKGRMLYRLQRGMPQTVAQQLLGLSSPPTGKQQVHVTFKLAAGRNAVAGIPTGPVAFSMVPYNMHGSTLYSMRSQSKLPYSAETSRSYVTTGDVVHLSQLGERPVRVKLYLAPRAQGQEEEGEEQHITGAQPAAAPPHVRHSAQQLALPMARRFDHAQGRQQHGATAPPATALRMAPPSAGAVNDGRGPQQVVRDQRVRSQGQKRPRAEVGELDDDDDDDDRGNDRQAADNDLYLDSAATAAERCGMPRVQPRPKSGPGIDRPVLLPPAKKPATGKAPAEGEGKGVSKAKAGAHARSLEGRGREVSCCCSSHSLMQRTSCVSQNLLLLVPARGPTSSITQPSCNGSNVLLRTIKGARLHTAACQYHTISLGANLLPLPLEQP